MISILLALTLSQSTSIIDVERASLNIRDGGVVDVVGGAWLSDVKLIEYATTQKQMREELKESKQAVSPVVIVVGVCVAFVSGAVAGIFVANKLR